MAYESLPIVSIIVPIYNADKYLKDCIESVLNQSFTKYELLLIDDGSEDNSLDICKYYAKIDCRIVVFKQENSGVSMARNAGIKLAKGKYITFLDSDDQLSNIYLERLLYYIKKTEADIVCAGHRITKRYNRYKNVAYPNKLYLEKEFVEKFYEFNKKISTAPWSKLYKRSIIEDNGVVFPKGVPYGEDAIFNIQYFMYCKKIYICSDILYDYNYTNVNTAVKKTYMEFVKYMRDIYLMIEKLYKFKNAEDVFMRIKEKEQCYFFEMAAKHFMLSDLSKTNIIQKLKEIKEYFPQAQNNNNWKYAKYVKNGDWNGYYSHWKKINKKLICKTRIKRWLHDIERI